MSDVPPMFRMPVGFGPSAGPRRGPAGERFDAAESVKALTCELRFATDAEALAALLPPGFELRGDPIVSVTIGYLSEIAWLAGRGYNVLGVYIPATHCGEVRTEGMFNAVLWENLTDPILTGRDELGIPKIYAEIEPLTVSAVHSYVARASWLGCEFARFEVKLGERHLEPGPAGAGYPVLAYKYVPATGAPGESDCAYAICVPAEDPSRRVVESWDVTGSVRFAEVTWRDMPTQHHIVSRLAALPVVESLGGTMISSVGAKDLSDTHRLD